MDDDIRDRFRGVRSRPVRAAQSRPLVRPQGLSAPPRAMSPPAVPPIPTEEPFIQPTSKPKKIKQKRRKRAKFLAVIFILTLLGLLFGSGHLYKKYIKKPTLPASSAQPAQASTPHISKPSGVIRFIVSGDNLAFESINNAAKKTDGGYDYVPLMDSLKPFMAKSDIRLCNESSPAGGEKLGLGTYPNFNAPLSWSTGFAAVGCNIMNLGSYHANDKGQAGIDAMAASWDGQKDMLAVAGSNRSPEEQAKIRYFTVKGVKFAYLTYTTSTNNAQVSAYGINKYSDDIASKQIAEAHKNANLIIVSMNWGNENSGDISPEQEHIAQTLASANVDIIAGIGPHVLQPAKVLGGTNGHQTLAWFSLGNFLNSQIPLENLIGGMAVMDIDVATQQVTAPKLLPFYMHYEWTAAQKATGTVNARANFKLMPLDQATEALAKSQNNTTVQAQTDRVKAIITKFAPINVIKSTEF